MYSLYINDKYMSPLSNFGEHVERTRSNDDTSIGIHLSLFIREDEVPSDFDIGVFSEYMKSNSIDNIKVKNDKTEKVIFNSNFYSEITHVKWFLNDDKPDGSIVNEIYIYLMR
jgi:hypothetical protein